MGADFTPSVELTGGPWYRDDRELDIELIETLLWVCDKYIVEKVRSLSLLCFDLC